MDFEIVKIKNGWLLTVWGERPDVEASASRDSEFFDDPDLLLEKVRSLIN